MPNLSWNTITANATLFARDWATATREQADKQLFWNDFFTVFGMPLRTVASFEVPVRQLRGTYGFIDLLWSGTLLVEHKTAGASLDAAEVQAFDYIQDLLISRATEVPRYVLLSDFRRFALYDLEPEDQLDFPLFRNRFRYTRVEFPLADLPLHVRDFAFIPGYQVPTSKPQDELNLKAVGIMARVHDTLRLGGYTGHELERFLVRVLFCLFADKTGIFQPESFRLFIKNRTSPDGSNLGAQLNELFATLDKPEERRLKHLDADLRAFPYVNGALFTERLDAAAFTGPMRAALLEACDFRWGEISPAIFGALFQEVINTDDDPKRRRKIGAHYTSERDILKVIRPLFLDKLRTEFEAIDRDRSGRRSTRLEDLRVRLTKLKFLDPACGCGNFLVVAYRELRSLELDILKSQHAGQQAFSLDEVNRLSQVDVHQFYGIEIEEWPARIAEVALWLMDHLANRRILAAFSQPFLRLPLKQSPHIHIDNALRMNWNDVLLAKECSYVMGNPPFVGKPYMSPAQKADMQHIARKLKIKSTGVLDYVAAWYFQAAEYTAGVATPVCFVSTNSITQGEQPAIIWDVLAGRYNLEIQFAYRTFPWESEARGKAHVHVVVIGVAAKTESMKVLHDVTPSGEPGYELVSAINPYLIDSKTAALKKRRKPISNAPPIIWGSMPNDDGNLLLTPNDRDELLRESPQAETYLRRIVGAKEFLHDLQRWCLWLVRADPAHLTSIPEISRRVEAVRNYRIRSTRTMTNQLAASPTLFGEIRQSDRPCLMIPRHFSKNYPIVPTKYMDPTVICGDANSFVADATLFDFGVLSSRMHIAWVDVVAGRIKSDYRYSNTLVYNNFPWPESATAAQRDAVERAARAVIEARALHPDRSLATLYDPLLVPELVKAHRKLDRAVERSYRPESFKSDRECIEFLFELHEKIITPLLPSIEPKRAQRKRKNAFAKSEEN